MGPKKRCCLGGGVVGGERIPFGSFERGQGGT